MPPEADDTLSSLEKAKERLYDPNAELLERQVVTAETRRSLPHAWKETILPSALTGPKRHVRLATVFLIFSFVFFLCSLSITAAVFYLGGNTVSVDKITIAIEGPTTIAGGDPVPLSLTITNKNAVAIEHAVIDITFPPGTRDANNVLTPYPRYSETVGTINSGETITRTVKAILFGGAGHTIVLPTALSYSAEGSNATFVKKTSYELTVSTTPLSLSADALSETVSGQSFPLTLTVTSNATVPLSNVVLTMAPPFGYVVNSSSVPLTNSSFLLGTLRPGVSKKITVMGTLSGQQSDQKSFHFTLGTATSPQDQVQAVTYTTLDMPVTITAPFIDTSLAINGDISANAILTPGTPQTVTLTYTNTLSTNVTNATVGVTLSGTAVDYTSIQASNGFYRSSDHTVLFSRDTDPSLAQLAPGTRGVGTFTFTTLPLGSLGSSPTITFSTSVSGTRVGESNVPESVTASMIKTAKVATNVTLTAASLHNSGSLVSSGPNPPRVGQTSTYAIVWSVKNSGSTVAGGAVTAILPSYVEFTGRTTGGGSYSYDAGSRTVTWHPGDLAQGATVQGAFQVSLNPSSSQKGQSPQLVGRSSFTGFDRFAGVTVNASADPTTTETRGDPGYSPTNAIVQ